MQLLRVLYAGLSQECWARTFVTPCPDWQVFIFNMCRETHGAGSKRGTFVWFGDTVRQTWYGSAVRHRPKMTSSCVFVLLQSQNCPINCWRLLFFCFEFFCHDGAYLQRWVSPWFGPPCLSRFPVELFALTELSVIICGGGGPPSAPGPASVSW